MANLGIIGSVLDGATGGWGHYYNQQKRQRGLLAEEQGLLGGLLPGSSGSGADTGAAQAAPAPMNLMDGATQARLARLAAINPKLATSILAIGSAGQDDVTQGDDGIIYSKRSGQKVNRLPSHSVVNGFNVDLGAPDAPSFIPTLPTGMMPDGRGGVQNLPRLPQAMGEQTAATEGAKAVYNPVQTTNAFGQPVTTTAAALAAGGPIVGRAPEVGKAAEIAATNQATAAAAVPGYIDTTNRVLGIIDTLTKDPALHTRTGMAGVLPPIPGTHGVAFDSQVDQLKGTAFLEAYNQLKGAGQISEAEGAKAEAAVARLSRKQSPEDFTKALNELGDVLRSGLKRTQQQAGGTAPAPRAASISREAAIAELKRRGKWPGQ